MLTSDVSMAQFKSQRFRSGAYAAGPGFAPNSQLTARMAKVHLYAPVPGLQIIFQTFRKSFPACLPPDRPAIARSIHVRSQYLSWSESRTEVWNNIQPSGGGYISSPYRVIPILDGNAIRASRNSIPASRYSISAPELSISASELLTSAPNYLLSAYNYSSSAGNYSLSALNYSLSACNYSLSAANFSLSAPNYASSECKTSISACRLSRSPATPLSPADAILHPIQQYKPSTSGRMASVKFNHLPLHSITHNTHPP